MVPSLPNRRPTAVPPARGGTPPRGSLIAVGVTAAILAAFAIGVLVGRNQSLPPLQPSVVEPAARPDTMQPQAPDAGPDIEMVRPDGTIAPEPAATAPGAAVAASAKPENQPTAPQAAAKAPEAAPIPAAEPEAAPVAKTPASQPRGIYTVQVAAFRDRESAERTSLELESRGYDAYVQRANVDEKGVWYRVRVGAFEDKAAAKRVAEQLEAREGKSAYVTIR